MAYGSNRESNIQALVYGTPDPSGPYVIRSGWAPIESLSCWTIFIPSLEVQKSWYASLYRWLAHSNDIIEWCNSPSSTLKCRWRRSRPRWTRIVDNILSGYSLFELLSSSDPHIIEDQVRDKYVPAGSWVNDSSL